MKFYGNGVIWDKEKNCNLCKFVNGEFETNDIIVIEKLRWLGVKCEETDEDRKVIAKTEKVIEESIKTTKRKRTSKK